MTLAQLVNAIADATHSTKRGAAAAARALAEAIALAVRRGERVAIPGFGVFYPKRHRARRILAPDGHPMRLPAVRSIGFRASKYQKRRAKR